MTKKLQILVGIFLLFDQKKNMFIQITPVLSPLEITVNASLCPVFVQQMEFHQVLLWKHLLFNDSRCFNSLFHDFYFLSLQVILILTKLYDFHIGSVTESTLWRWVHIQLYILFLPG